MRRLWRFILGLWIIIVVGVLLFIVVDYKDFESYQEQLINYNWFWPTLYATAGLLAAVGLIYIILALKPSHRSRRLIYNYPDGELQINKKSIEKNVLYTVRKYDAIRQPTIQVKLFQKKDSSYMDVDVDVFVTQVENVQQYLNTLREDIKQSAETFAELPIRELNINVLDQRTLKKRVL